MSQYKNEEIAKAIREGKYKRKVPEPKIADRWSDGVDHESESIDIVELIGDMDFENFGDYFCWRIGGDGDNGESLAYVIDALIENGLVKIEITEEGKKCLR